MEKLCLKCVETCSFRETANSIAAGVKEYSDESKQIKASLAAHEAIAQERIIARDKGCPQLNDINPSYQGKDLL